MAGGGRRGWRRTLAWPGAQSGQYGDRRSPRRTGHHACAYDLGGYRSHQWTFSAPIRGGAAPGKDLLDHLSESDFDAAQDSDIPRLAAFRGSQRPTPVEESWARTASLEELSSEMVDNSR